MPLTTCSGYTRRVLDLAVMNAGIHGWPLDGMPLEGAVDALVGDGIDPPVARHVITMFASPPTADGAADGSVALDARAVCAEKACSLLEERTVWRLPDFEAAWTKACPQDMPPQLDILRGLALVEPQGVSAHGKRPAALLHVDSRRACLLSVCQHRGGSHCVRLPGFRSAAQAQGAVRHAVRPQGALVPARAGAVFGACRGGKGQRGRPPAGLVPPQHEQRRRGGVHAAPRGVNQCGMMMSDTGEPPLF